MITGNILFLAMVLAAFGTFMIVLGGVSIWSQMTPAERAPAPVKAVRPRGGVFTNAVKA
jgi:hypothetical protein